MMKSRSLRRSCAFECGGLNFEDCTVNRDGNLHRYYLVVKLAVTIIGLGSRSKQNSYDENNTKSSRVDVFCLGAA